MNLRFLAAFLLAMSPTVSYADQCFNASDIIDKANSPFNSAPDLANSVIDAADKFGWTVEAPEAEAAGYFIIGKYGTLVGENNLTVCVTNNIEGGLAYRVFAGQSGKENAGFMPLAGIEK